MGHFLINADTDRLLMFYLVLIVLIRFFYIVAIYSGCSKRFSNEITLVIEVITKNHTVVKNNMI